MNRLRDGLYSSTLILPGEHQAEFDRIRAGYQDLYQPRDAADRHMVDELSAIEAGVLIEHGDDLAGECLGPYDRVMRIHGRLHRAWFKLYKELESIKAARKKNCRSRSQCLNLSSTALRTRPPWPIRQPLKPVARSPTFRHPHPAPPLEPNPQLAAHRHLRLQCSKLA
jgi:hypothetical protein